MAEDSFNNNQNQLFVGTMLDVYDTFNQEGIPGIIHDIKDNSICLRYRNGIKNMEWMDRKLTPFLLKRPVNKYECKLLIYGYIRRQSTEHNIIIHADLYPTYFLFYYASSWICHSCKSKVSLNSITCHNCRQFRPVAGVTDWICQCAVSLKAWVNEQDLKKYLLEIYVRNKL